MKCLAAGSSIMNREVESASVTVCVCVKCLAASSSIMNREVESASVTVLLCEVSVSGLQYNES